MKDNDKEKRFREMLDPTTRARLAEIAKAMAAMGRLTNAEEQEARQRVGFHPKSNGFAGPVLKFIADASLTEDATEREDCLDAVFEVLRGAMKKADSGAFRDTADAIDFLAGRKRTTRRKPTRLHEALVVRIKLESELGQPPNRSEVKRVLIDDHDWDPGYKWSELWASDGLDDLPHGRAGAPRSSGC